MATTLFLDFDGVLNNDGFIRHQMNHAGPGEPAIFDPVNVEALNTLVASLPITQIVISSTWKKHRSLAEIRRSLRDAGFTYGERVIDVTPDLGFYFEARADEIKAWIAMHQPPSVLVLDDLNLTGLIDDGFIHVNPVEGLSERLVEMIVRVRNA